MNNAPIVIGLALTLFFSPQERALMDQPINREKSIQSAPSTEPERVVHPPAIQGAGYLKKGSKSIEQWGRDPALPIRRVQP